MHSLLGTLVLIQPSTESLCADLARVPGPNLSASPRWLELCSFARPRLRLAQPRGLQGFEVLEGRAPEMPRAHCSSTAPCGIPCIPHRKSYRPRRFRGRNQTSHRDSSRLLATVPRGSDQEDKVEHVTVTHFGTDNIAVADAVRRNDFGIADWQFLDADLRQSGWAGLPQRRTLSQLPASTAFLEKPWLMTSFRRWRRAKNRSVLGNLPGSEDMASKATISIRPCELCAFIIQFANRHRSHDDEHTFSVSPSGLDT